MIQRYRAQTGRSVGVITMILTLSAAAIAVGVVYNNARIALSHAQPRPGEPARARLHAPRDLDDPPRRARRAGARRRSRSACVLGYLWAKLYAAAVSPETMRFPFHIAPATYGAAALIALVAGLVSALLVRRRLDRLDLVAVLKATE